MVCTVDNEIIYSEDLCEIASNCFSSDNCDECHNLIEYYYHPYRFKTQPCSFNECPKEMCPFYHS